MKPIHSRLDRRQWLALAAGLSSWLSADLAWGGGAVAGWLVSEKLDGVRAHWDGRTLRFRSGRLIEAPDWFVARLPNTPLEGELWLGRGRFDQLSGLVRRASPDDEAWRHVRYMLFELPGAAGPFTERARELEVLAQRVGCPQLQAVPQRHVADRAGLGPWLEEVVRGGGEGLMLHRADAPYRVGRSADVVKLKPQQDEDAVVIGHLPGRGRHAGRLGALRVRRADGSVFDLGTGLDDAQRSEPPPLGSTVTYTFRGRTPNGLPRFASFLRVRPDA